MRISALNGIPAVKNYGNLKNKNIQKTQEVQKNERNLLDYPKAYKPSFGFIDPMIISIIGEILFLSGAAIYTETVDQKEREKQEQQLLAERNKEIHEVANQFNISTKEATKYHDKYMKIAQIDFVKDNGEQIGLNAVMGYGAEKYKLAADFITPLVAKEKNIEKGGKVSNGLLLYGPAGSGKTYMAQKACEHLDYFNVNVENLELTSDDHEKNAQMITEAFERGKERFWEEEKYTVINFTRGLDEFFANRNVNIDTIPEVAAFLDAAENCAEDGVTWIGTAVNPRNLDPAVLRAGRTGMKLAIGNMKKCAVADTLSYFLVKHGEKDSAIEIDYQKVVDRVEEEMLLFTPAELEVIVENAKKNKIHPEQILNADDLLREMYDYRENGFPVLDSSEIKKFREDKNYVQTFEPEEPVEEEEEEEDPLEIIRREHPYPKDDDDDDDWFGDWFYV